MALSGVTDKMGGSLQELVRFQGNSSVRRTLAGCIQLGTELFNVKKMKMTQLVQESALLAIYSYYYRAFSSPSLFSYAEGQCIRLYRSRAHLGSRWKAQFLHR